MPARFQLVIAITPCPCGQGPGAESCRCGQGQVKAYWRRLSGPLLDRIDLVVTVEGPAIDELVEGQRGESSQRVRERVTAARDKQVERCGRLALLADRPTLDASPANGALPARSLRRACHLSASRRRRAREEAEQLGISARGWHRVLRVARTIADLSGHEHIRSSDLAEAFQYRRQNASLSATATQFTAT